MCRKTDLPVLGVPVKSSILNGVDSLLSIVQMPAGIAVGTLAIGPAGATNAAIMAAQILGLTRPEIAKMLLISVLQTDKVASKIFRVRCKRLRWIKLSVFLVVGNWAV